MAEEERRIPARRVTFVADELLGYAPNGIGTTTTFLSLALARVGHRVRVLYLGENVKKPIDPEWGRLYESFGIDVQIVRRGDEAIEPTFMARMRDVELALRSDSADVVIAQDLGAPAYTAMRLRQLGLAFGSTSYVVLCHGTRQWITDASRKVRVLPGALAVSVLERASIELADVVVSPSAYMVDWMRRQGWHLPERTFVIPHITRSSATGEPPPEPAGVDALGGVRRIAFFGRLEERKGLRPFLTATNALEPELLSQLELAFVGRPTPAWSPDDVETLLSERTRSAIHGIAFETALDQHQALASLSRPGTLAVMPSLEENSPNTVYECLERRIPFITSNVGGAGELVAQSDRPRVLFDPTPAGIENALRRALTNGMHPAQPAFSGAASLQGWQEVLALHARAVEPLDEEGAVDVVVVHGRSREALARCVSALSAQRYGSVSVTVALAGPGVPEPQGLVGPTRVVRSERSDIPAARQEGLRAGSAPWVLFLDEEDVAEDTLVETLVRAQSTSGADVVSCGLFLRGNGAQERRVYCFPGQPRSLGVLSNGYGNAALIRRSLLTDLTTSWPVENDPDWPLLAGLSAAGADIVSVPTPLLTRRARPGTLDRAPSDALLVAEQLERSLPGQLASVARLAVGLAAQAHTPAPVRAGLRGRALRRLAKSLR